jgi:hypothetical protein
VHACTSWNRAIKHDYLKLVQWSHEDQLFVGYCPDFFIGAICHGTEAVEVYRELSQLVAEEIAEEDGKLKMEDGKRRGWRAR